MMDSPPLTGDAEGCDESRDRMDHELTFLQIVDGISGLITVTTADGQVALVNQQVLDYFGKSLDELKQWTATDVVHPDDLPRVVDAWQQSVRLGEPYELEHRIRRADGEYRWFHVRGLPVRDAAGRILRWFVVHTDIHERKRAEALLAGERRLLEMVASGDSLPVVLDGLCRLVEDNGGDCYCSVVLIDRGGTRLQHGAAPSLPASFNDSIHGRPVNVDSGPCAMAAYLREQVISADIMAETRWETYAWCPLALAHGLRACWSTPILSRTKKVLGAFAIYYREPKTPTALDQNLIEQFTHIASIAVERAEAEAALKRSEAFLAEEQHLNRTGSFLWRASTDEITWSKEMYRIYEFSESEPLTHERANARVHPDDFAMYMGQVARAKREPVEVDFDVRLRFPNGSIKYLHVVSHGSRDESGNVEYTGAVQDITDRQRAEDALVKLQAELAHVARVSTLGALTASIAHEVNQPLSGIITNASTCLRMLAEEPPNLDGARETARRTIRDGRRASDVIARLRALFAKRETTTEPVDLSDATREVVALSLSELQRNRVTLRAELGDDLPPVAGDRIQLQQVILNLLLNASQAMRDVSDRPRELIVKTQRDAGDCVQLSVRDVGVGFAPEDADRLFETFYTTKSGGMGIGLSVSRTIIESHGGHLWATRNDGPGATFTFSIPCRSNNAPWAFTGRTPFARMG
jgi:PAS domain S-box-containing protein